MACEGNVAAQKVWATPELAEKILPFLNFESILRLAQSELLNRDILQGPCVWNKLIRRRWGNDRPEVVKILVRILKLMKDPSTAMLDRPDLREKTCWQLMGANGLSSPP